MKIEKADFMKHIVGTSLKGYVTIAGHELVELFGEPDRNVCDKTSTQWSMLIDGVVVNIYDYYSVGSMDTPYEWHIGGHSMDAVTKVAELIEREERQGFVETRKENYDRKFGVTA